MKNFTNNELKILADLLEMASNEFCNHGCNDYELENSVENFKIISSNFYCDDEEFKPEYNPNNKKIYAQDTMLMDYFKNKIERMIDD